MLSAGLVKLVVVDDYKAQLWAKVFPKIVPHPEAAVHTGGEVAAMLRKDSPLLQAELAAFVKTHGKGTVFGNTRGPQVHGSTRFVKPATSTAEVAKYERTVKLFQTYGDKYGLDHLLLMAQGYQESRLDQTVKSPVGAIGVMQVMPATAKDLAVGDVGELDANIHAGVKYIRFMVDKYYADEPMDDVNKALFAFASYNAGPARVRAAPQGSGGQGPEPEHLVPQRRHDRRRTHRRRDRDLRLQHLQVLRRLPAPRRRRRGETEGEGRAQEGRVAPPAWEA